PLAVLQEANVSYDELTQAILANPSGVNPEVQTLKAKIAELEQNFDKRFSDRDTQTEREALSHMRRNVDSLVSQGDDFEMIRETGSQGDVVEVIRQVYKTEGIML